MHDHAALMCDCRRALGLSVEGMRRALCLSSGRTVRRMEEGDLSIYGPTWVAVAGLLRAAGRDDLALVVDDVCAELRDNGRE